MFTTRVGLSQPGFVKMSGCWHGFFSSNFFFFVSGRGAHGKVHQETKAAKVVFLTRQLQVCVLWCAVSLSSPDMAFPSPKGPLLPGGVSEASLKSDDRQRVFCILSSPLSQSHCQSRGERPPFGASWGALVPGDPGGASPAPCPERVKAPGWPLWRARRPSLFKDVLVNRGGGWIYEGRVYLIFPGIV